MENEMKGLRPLSAENAQEIAEDYQHPPVQFLKQRAVKPETYYVLSQRVWAQTSSDGSAQVRMRTKVVTYQTTVAEIIEWAQQGGFGSGDVAVTKSE